MNKKNRGLLIYLIVIIGFFAVAFALLRDSAAAPKQEEYSTIMGYFDKCQVYDMTVDLGTAQMTIKVYASDSNNDGIYDSDSKTITYEIPNLSIFLNEIQSGERNYRIEYDKLHPNAPLKQDYYKIQDTSWLITLIPSLIIIGLMIALFVFTLRQTGGGGRIMGFGKANVKNTTSKKVMFDDVAGADEEKAELVEVVDFLKNPKKYRDIGARIPKGVLLMGPPGTGKTLLAKAVSGEAGVPFFPISGSDFVEMYVGVGASRVRDLFETAKKSAPAIIFIDEIDAVGRHRGAGLGGGHDEREQTLNQLLVEMDGFEGNEGIIAIAATNRKDILDPALLRPGRFDRQIVVNYPDIKGREEILKVHAKNKKIGPDVDLHIIAKTTQGFTGADLENLLNEAALLAARNNRKAIIEADIEEATLKVMAGPEKKSHVVTERDKKITAFHEAGHAIAATNLETQEKVHQVTVIPRGMAAGLTFTRQSDEEHVTKRKMFEAIVMMLGGRAAETVMFEDVCTGASSDLKRATAAATDMVIKYGFSENLGNVVYGVDSEEVFIGRDYGHTKNYSDETAAEIDSEIRSIIDKAFEESKEILTAHKDDLILLAKYLIKNEKIDGKDFEKLLAGELDFNPDEVDLGSPDDLRKVNAKTLTDEES
ncbi:MAG: ATP-dependent zinc metalloprotease FtsH [Ruminococcus sp.]|jgi:cell division protease FtsH|nr:ATP-dependent zinc metalloprotease FtsH [Ruminococcus sp.]